MCLEFLLCENCMNRVYMISYANFPLTSCKIFLLLNNKIYILGVYPKVGIDCFHGVYFTIHILGTGQVFIWEQVFCRRAAKHQTHDSEQYVQVSQHSAWRKRAVWRGSSGRERFYFARRWRNWTWYDFTFLSFLHSLWWCRFSFSLSFTGSLLFFWWLTISL